MQRRPCRIPGSVGGASGEKSWRGILTWTNSSERKNVGRARLADRELFEQHSPRGVQIFFAHNEIERWCAGSCVPGRVGFAACLLRCRQTDVLDEPLVDERRSGRAAAHG